MVILKSALTFNGIGHIIKGAKGQTPNKKAVLMLGPQARSDANPILLIDEMMTAGHAASIGQVDPEDMYHHEPWLGLAPQNA